jgi:23S rRNA pseudouridine955/2504/2580 synthase
MEAKPIKISRFPEIIIHEDDDLIIINKPAFISSLDERNAESASIVSMAKKYCATASLCHRLDKETSGVLIIAKNQEAYREIAIQLENRNVGKLYHAVVADHAEFNELEVKLPLHTTAKGVAVVDYNKGKEAFTIFQSLKFFGHFTLVGCQPLSGRLHQIRVHLASQNFPIVGDELYGGKKPMLSSIKRKFKVGKWSNEEPMMKRVALHAYQIHFELKGEEHIYTAPYPKDFDVFLKLLEKYDSVE